MPADIRENQLQTMLAATVMVVSGSRDEDQQL